MLSQRFKKAAGTLANVAKVGLGAAGIVGGVTSLAHGNLRGVPDILGGVDTIKKGLKNLGSGPRRAQAFG